MLNDEIYKAILRERQRKRRAPGRYIHPSSLECVRRMAFELTGFPARSKIDPGLQSIMDLGNAVHDIVQTNLKEYIGQVLPGSSFEAECQIDPDNNAKAATYFVRGRADGIGYEPTDSWVLEIKSVNITKLAATTRILPDHREQVNMYMFLLDIPKGYVMYVAREDLTRFSILPTAFDSGTWEFTAGKIRVAIDAAIGERLPPTNSDGRTCQICPYRYACKERARWVDAADLHPGS